MLWYFTAKSALLQSYLAACLARSVVCAVRLVFRRSRVTRYRIRLYRFLIIAFLSTLIPDLTTYLSSRFVHELISAAILALKGHLLAAGESMGT